MTSRCQYIDQKLQDAAGRDLKPGTGQEAVRQLEGQMT